MRRGLLVLSTVLIAIVLVPAAAAVKPDREPVPAPGDKVITQGLANVKQDTKLKAVPASAAQKVAPRPAGEAGAVINPAPRRHGPPPASPRA